MASILLWFTTMTAPYTVIVNGHCYTVQKGKSELKDSGNVTDPAAE